MPFLPVDTAVVVEVGPLIDNSNYKDLETAIAHNESGMSVDLIKNSGTAITKVDITPTTGGSNDWTHKGNGVYELEITAAQNNTKGTIRVVGVCDGVLPFESPVYVVVDEAVYNAIMGAAGFATPANVSSAQTAIITEIDANETKIDTAISNIGTVSGKADAIQAKTDNLPTDPADDSDIDTQLESIQADITTLLSHNVGAGAIEWTYTLTDADTGFPIADADVWVTTDEAGENVIASGRTNQSGVVTFYLDAGDVYIWRAKTGWNFDNPDQEAVS